MKWLGRASILLLLASCQSEPPPVERSELEQAAEALLQLHNGDEGSAARFAKHPASMVHRMAWFREQIGACDRYELYRSFGPERARFVYHCDRGQLEALIGLADDGRVKQLLTGARGVNPPTEVRAAAERWLDSPDAAAEADGCRIDRVHLGSVSGALFVLVCPDGEKTLKTELDHGGMPRHIEVFDRALDEWRVPVHAG